MSDFITKKCDGCGKLRASDTNHWLVGRVSGESITVVPLDQTLPEIYRTKDQHFCGQNCATQWFATEVGKLK
jgi:hypothetical protein